MDIRRQMSTLFHTSIFIFTKQPPEYQSTVVEEPLMEKLPLPAYLPANYIPLPGGVPGMGKHWVDVTSPELRPIDPVPFTTTLIYGTYNGEVTFLEPMVTMAVLQSGQSLTSPIPQPKLVSPTNTFYPTAYNINMDNDKHYVALSDFVWR